MDSPSRRNDVSPPFYNYNYKLQLILNPVNPVNYVSKDQVTGNRISSQGSGRKLPLWSTEITVTLNQNYRYT